MNTNYTDTEKQRKQGVTILHRYREVLALLPPEEQGKILMSSLEYDENGTKQEHENLTTKAIFVLMRQDFDMMNDTDEKREEKRIMYHERGKAGAAKRWADHDKNGKNAKSNSSNAKNISHEKDAESEDDD